MRPKFDSTDFMQDVWASYYARPAEKRTFQSPKALLVYLTTLAQNKVIDKIRQRLGTQKHNLNREHSLDDSTQFDKSNLIAWPACNSIFQNYHLLQLGAEAYRQGKMSWCLKL